MMDTQDHPSVDPRRINPRKSIGDIKIPAHRHSILESLVAQSIFVFKLFFFISTGCISSFHLFLLILFLFSNLMAICYLSVDQIFLSHSP